MRVRSAQLCSLLGLLVACSGAEASRPARASAPIAAPPPLPPAVEPAPPPGPPPPAPPQESPGFAEALAALRPSGTEAQLAALSAAPTSAEPYAQAALAYATTDAAGMTLIWGMIYQAMGGGASDAALGRAFSKVLVERIQAGLADNGQDLTFNLRLAPGRMPARQYSDGSVEAPLAHVFEALFGPAVVGFRPPWTIEQFYDAISTWAGIVSSRGTPLDEKLELDGWLVTTAKAGHLEAYCHQLLGAAYPTEFKAYSAKNGPALKAYRAYSKSSALTPSSAVMPDDLVRIPAPPEM